MKTKTILLLACILLFSQLPAEATQTCGPYVEGSGMDGDFLLGVSYYGAIGYSNASEMTGDLEDFKKRGLNHVRVWGNWTHWGATNSTIFNSDGNINGGAMGRLKLIITEAQLRNMTVDVTFSWRHFKQNQCTSSDDAVCFGRFKTGVRNSTQQLAGPGYRNAFFDLANESNSGVTGLNDTEVREVKAEVFGQDRTRVVTVSTVGSISGQASRFNALLGDDTIDFAAPHFLRTRDWAVETDDRIDALRTALTDPWPIHLQEESRRGNTCSEDENNTTAWCCGKADSPPPPPGDESDCELDDFLLALGLAAQEGAAGWLLHTDAGFKLDEPQIDSFWDELDPVEKNVMNAMAVTLGEFRCQPAPVYSDNFDDAMDGTDLQGRALQVGSAIWDTVEPAWRLQTLNHRLTTANPAGVPVGGIPYHLPLGFEGTASVEAKLVIGPADSVSIGFSTNPDQELAEFGLFWVAIEDDGYIHVYGQNSVPLGTLYTILPVTEATVKLEYRGGPKARVRLFSKNTFGGWTEHISASVTEKVIGAAVAEIEFGSNNLSYVDDFAVRLAP